MSQGTYESAGPLADDGKLAQSAVADGAAPQSIDRLILIGLSHKTAPLPVRERMARLGEDLPGTLSSLTRLPGITEGMVLSTCNRVELYGAGSPPDRAALALREFVRERGLAAADPLHVYERRGEAALRHLFRVASSLDSMVVGEPQILGQLKGAFQAATTAGATGDCLHRAVGRAFSVAKRVRTETSVGRNAVSMSFAAVEVARKIFASLAGKRVLIVGAGEMATLAARHLAAQGVSDLAIANRSLERAQAAALSLASTGRRVTAHGLSDLPELLVAVDIVVAAVAAPAPIVTRELAARAVKQRRFRPLLVVDLSVPRAVDLGLRALTNVYLKDLDDLGALVRRNTEQRAAEADRAEAIVELEVREFSRVLRGRSAAPVLADLRRLGDAISESELRRTLQQLGPEVSEKGRASVEAMARAIVNKLLHEPTSTLRRAAELGVEAELADATARLFGLAPECPPAADDDEDD